MPVSYPRHCAQEAQGREWSSVVGHWPANSAWALSSVPSIEVGGEGGKEGREVVEEKKEEREIEMRNCA